MRSELKGYRFGFELECFLALTPEKVKKKFQEEWFPCHHRYLRSWSDRDSSAFWSFGTDGTIVPDVDKEESKKRWGLEELELASPIMEFTPKPPKEMFRAVRLLQTLGAEVNRTCGLHIHVSGPEKLNARHLTTRFKAFVDLGNPTRMQAFCMFEPPDDDTKHWVVRQVEDNHVEFRVFNATLNLRAIAHAYKMVRSVLLAVTPDSVPAAEAQAL